MLHGNSPVIEQSNVGPNNTAKLSKKAFKTLSRYSLLYVHGWNSQEVDPSLSPCMEYS